MSLIKADLKNLATKDDLKSETKKLKNEILASKGEMTMRLIKHEEKTETMIKKFTNKILNHIDAFLKELVNTREEQLIIGHQVTDHEQRIKHLETAL